MVQDNDTDCFEGHTLCQQQIILYSALLQDLLGFRLDEAVEKEKGSSSGLVSLSRPSSASELTQQGNGYDH